jgi:hypothetical protein
METAPVEYAECAVAGLFLRMNAQIRQQLITVAGCSAFA